MSWVYLLQVNVSCNWGAEKQQSHNNERREDPVQNLLEFGSRHGPQRRVYIRDLEVWLKMPNESDYWCDYWQIHESDLFTSGKDSIPLFCLLFNHIMTFSFFLYGSSLYWLPNLVNTQGSNTWHESIKHSTVTTYGLFVFLVGNMLYKYYLCTFSQIFVLFCDFLQTTTNNFNTLIVEFGYFSQYICHF